MMNVIKTNFLPIFYFAGTIASIISLGIFGVNDPVRANIALSLICLFLLLIFLKALSILNSFLRQDYPNGYTTDSVFVKYTTKDGNKVDYEIYKHIQCKQLLMNEFEHGYSWSGTHDPEISSDLQKIERTEKSTDGTWDKVILGFEPPLKYNDCETIHISMKADDTDHKASTHIESRVISPLKVLKWRVELQHKPSGYKGTAKLTRRNASPKFPHPYEDIRTVAFDAHSRSFEVTIPKPHIGYFYRLKWDR